MLMEETDGFYRGERGREKETEIMQMLLELHHHAVHQVIGVLLREVPRFFE